MSAGPERYGQFATDYYEMEVPLAPLRGFYDHAKISIDVVTRLNPDSEADPVAVVEEIRGMGYGQEFPFS